MDYGGIGPKYGGCGHVTLGQLEIFKMAPKNGGKNKILFFWFILACNTSLYTFSRALITNLTLNLVLHPATIYTGRKLRGRAVPPFSGELGPHLTQSRLGRGLYLHTKWHLNPSSRLATTDMGRKLGGVPQLEGKCWVPI